jgi:hypothetical protein
MLFYSARTEHAVELTVRVLVTLPGPISRRDQQRERTMGYAAEQKALPMHVSPPIAPHGAAADTPDVAQMVQRLMERRPLSGSHALKELRAAFPDTPLALRVAALNMLLRQRLGEAGSSH